MISGEEEADILTYFNDDEPESAEINVFAQVLIVRLNLSREVT
jgi:hypothetical protein